MPDLFTHDELSLIEEMSMMELENIHTGEVSDLDLPTLPVHEFDGSPARVQSLQSLAKKARNQI